jgi:hypothetical protein
MAAQTSPGTVARTAAIITGSGTLLVCVVLQAANPNPVRIRRITSPTTNSQWAATQATLSTNGHAASGAALALVGTTIRAFWCDHTALSIYYSESTDDGVTWSAQVLLKALPAGGYTECTGIAAPTNTDVLSTWYIYPQAASNIFESQYAAGVWGAWTQVGPATPTWGRIYGLTLDAKGGSPYPVIAGVQMRAQISGIAASWSNWNGAGGAWTGWTHIQPMDTSTNGLTHPYPTVHFDTPSGLYYATLNLVDDGTVSGLGQQRTTIWSSPDLLQWSLVQSLFANLQYEVHTFLIGGKQYTFDGANVYNAPAAAAPLTLDTDCLSIHITEKVSTPTQFTIVLANDQGQYQNQGQLKDNASILINLGYSADTINTHTCYIDDVMFTAAGTRATCTIRGRCLLKFLDLPCTVYTPFTSQTVSAIAKGILRAANVKAGTVAATSQFSQTIPSFAIVPGQTWLNALKRLSDVYQFDFFCATPPSVKIAERLAADASTWSYGTETLALAWQSSADQPNVIRVIGAPSGTTNLFAETIDSANLHASGAHRYRHIVDRMLDTNIKCQLKGTLALRDDQTQAQTGTATVSINPKHELMDVIDITDSRAVNGAQHCRINEIRTQIDWQTGQWDQQLGLELP